MRLARRSLLALSLPAVLGACGSRVPLRTSFPPLSFDYLLKLQLNVASIEIAPPPPLAPLDAQAPIPPADALLQMARDRLVAGGSLGRAVFTIDQAQIVRLPNGLEGTMAVHLDVQTSEGTRAGFAEARVSRRIVGDVDDLRGSLYDIVSQMMGDMNVEFEFQVRRTLRDWLQDVSPTAPPPAPVQAQPLTQ